MIGKLRRAASEARADVSDSDGFTLIELLIVVVIIGILAAIAIPQFSSTKEQAYVATLKSDLRNAMTQAEAHFAQNGNYTSMTTNDIQSSENVTVDNVSAASSPASFCVDMTHSELGSESWAIANTTSSPPAPSNYSVPGEPVQATCG